MNPFDETVTLHLNDSQVVWDRLAQCIETLATAWEETGVPPRLADFLPREPAALRRMAIIELIKVDMEYRWSTDQTLQRIEDYLAEFPELTDEGGAPVDLLYEEFHIRRRCGSDVDVREYFERFPQRRDDLRRLVGIDDPLGTTTRICALARDHLEAGDSIDDFDLLTRLGQGAFASVFLARQRSMQRLVALKVSADRGSEPQTLAQLDHPHIVRVYDLRRLPERGVRLLYMQYVRGGTLQDAIQFAGENASAQRGGKTLLAAVDQALDQRGESPPIDSSLRGRVADATWTEVVCWMGMQLADALQYAHSHGVLHRDLKPANILLTDEAAPKLVDFNISCCSKVEGASPAAYFGGSLAYMSPEQLDVANPARDERPESLTPASDVFSLGIVLWELLTLERPFGDENLKDRWGQTLDDLAARRKSGVPANAIARLPGGCPDALREILLTCLAPHPQDRYASAGELSDELRLCLHPAAQAVLRAPDRGWRRLTRQFSVVALVLTALLPNALAGVFNYVYNDQQIVEQLGPEAVVVFRKVMLTINAVAFPLGVAVAIRLFWPVRHALLSVPARAGPANVDAASALKRCLQIGHFVALIGIAEWTIAGIAYPVALESLGADLALNQFVHFVVSLAICGLIAAAYPFFLLAVLGMRAWLPPLFRPRLVTGDDCQQLEWLGRVVWYYLGVAALVPMLAVVLLNFSGSTNRTALGVVSGSSVVGLLAIFFMARMLQHDIRALVDLIGAKKQSFSE